MLNHYWPLIILNYKTYFNSCYSYLHWWSSQTDWRLNSNPRTSGSLPEWDVGHCMWWFLEWCGCQCCLQTTGLLKI